MAAGNQAAGADAKLQVEGMADQAVFLCQARQNASARADFSRVNLAGYTNAHD